MREQMNYTKDSVQTGQMLVIFARTADENVSPRNEHVFVSGRIQSKDTFLYGRFEFVAKLPKGRGIWPALWLRTRMDKPIDGEIDVIEGFGSTPSVIQSTLHPWRDGKEEHYDCVLLRTQKTLRFHRSKCDNVDLKGPERDLSADFHTYTVVWTPDRITWMLDHIAYFTLTRDIPHDPMILVINLSVSSNWDGDLDDSLKLPQALMVKSVSVRPVH
jgi:beta-glucanase (GH16 family)